MKQQQTARSVCNAEQFQGKLNMNYVELEAQGLSGANIARNAFAMEEVSFETSFEGSVRVDRSQTCRVNFQMEGSACRKPREAMKMWF